MYSQSSAAKADAEEKPEADAEAEAEAEAEVEAEAEAEAGHRYPLRATILIYVVATGFGCRRPSADRTDSHYSQKATRTRATHQTRDNAATTATPYRALEDNYWPPDDGRARGSSGGLVRGRAGAHRHHRSTGVRTFMVSYPRRGI